MASYSSKKYPSGSITTAQLADGTVAAVDLANGSVTVDKLGTGSVTNAKLASTAVSIDKVDNTVSQLFGMRNKVINGDMRVDQRNNGASVSGSSTFTVDRWRFDASNAGNFSAQRIADAPPGFRNSIRITTTTAFAANVAQFFNHHIEGFNVADLMMGTANAATFTLSFWVKASIAGTYSVAITNNANDYAYPTTYTVNSANTWEYKTITIPGPTAGTWLTDNNVGLRIKYNLNSGAFYASTANTWVAADRAIVAGTVGIGATLNATLQLTGVQLERGSTATPFEFRPYGLEISLCQRYYWNLNPVTGNTTPFNISWYSNTARSTLMCPVHMRAAPTVTASGGNPGFFFTTINDVNYTNFSYVATGVEQGLSFTTVVLYLTADTAGPGSSIMYIQNNRLYQVSAEL